MRVIAHRGASGYAPENTLAAFRRAVELGAGFIETDLHLTRDAHLVAIHDGTLDRTTSGSGAVSRFTRAELSALDAGAWRGAEFVGERIPTLEEVLAFGEENKIVFYLEMKATAMWEPVLALAGAIGTARAASRVVIISFDVATIGAVVEREPTVMTGLLFDRADRQIVNKALAVGARQVLPRGDLVTTTFLTEARDAGLHVITWTINKPKDMLQLIAAGVDGIITDYPDRLLAVAREAMLKS